MDTSTVKDSPYHLRISRLTVDKLGVKLYDKASAVVAELIANGYDADAETITVRLPLNHQLASQAGGKLAVPSTGSWRKALLRAGLGGTS